VSQLNRMGSAGSTPRLEISASRQLLSIERFLHGGRELRLKGRQRGWSETHAVKTNGHPTDDRRARTSRAEVRLQIPVVAPGVPDPRCCWRDGARSARTLSEATTQVVAF